jgi:transposase
MEIERRVAREAKAVTRNEIIVRAIAGDLTWIKAAQICGVSPRQMRRMKRRFEERGYDGLVDARGGKPRRKRIPMETIEQICKLRREKYEDFSVQHFWEKLVEEHAVKISYTWTKLTLQAAGLAEKSPGRGKYRRQRERRSMRGMMLHMDGSTHEWIPGLPSYDLIVVQDDADSRILHARFVPEEGTHSTLAALKAVFTEHGRFCELYTDRASHYCHNAEAGGEPRIDHNGQVSRVLKALGIRQILARSPQARGRSERTFGTIQGRLPQELRAAGITNYEDANVYLDRRFLADFNRRFTVEPAEAQSAFVPLLGVDLELLVSVQRDRVVQNDSTVRFQGRTLQLPPTRQRAHFVRCPVLVHEFPEGGLGVSYQGHLLARYSSEGQVLAIQATSPSRRRGKALVALRAPSASPRPPKPRPPHSPMSTQPSGHL